MYKPSNNRYTEMTYRYCGSSGLRLPLFSLGLWHNAGEEANKENLKELIFTAFDLGITHFDLANNYGPPPGSAELNFGTILNNDLKEYRDELIISTKAGYEMWSGPYGDGGSRKYLLSSLDQSLKRMRLEYVDIFYHHRMDPSTPLEETMNALDSAVRSGNALYVGLSNYSGEVLKEAEAILRSLRTPFIINQNRYNIFDRTIEDNGLLESSAKLGKGIITFSPLAQGLLTNRYLNGIPSDSRINTDGRFLKKDRLTESLMEKIKKLDNLASLRGQTLAEMSLSWLLSDDRITSVLIGASKAEQIKENVKAMNNISFTDEEYKVIDNIVMGA